jgi:hypothetical protein
MCDLEAVEFVHQDRDADGDMRLSCNEECGVIGRLNVGLQPYLLLA